MKPIVDVGVTTVEGESIDIKAVFDSGSFYTIIREDILPEKTFVPKYKTPKTFGTARQGATLQVNGELTLTIAYMGKMINTMVLVSPDLKSNLLIGAGTMQQWDISLLNKNGRTEVVFSHDMRDPDITEVD